MRAVALYTGVAGLALVEMAKVAIVVVVTSAGLSIVTCIVFGSTGTNTIPNPGAISPETVA